MIHADNELAGWRSPAGGDNFNDQDGGKEAAQGGLQSHRAAPSNNSSEHLEHRLGLGSTPSGRYPCLQDLEWSQSLTFC
jgi:hypothetical protein